MPDDSKTKPTPPSSLKVKAAVDRMMAAVRKKYGEEVKLVSGVFVDADGKRHPLPPEWAGAENADQESERAVDNDNFTLARREDGDLELVILPTPPRHLQEAAHQELGNLLRDLQARYDSGEMKCIAAVWTDEHGSAFPAVAGMEAGGVLPGALADLADSFVNEADWTSADDESGKH